VTQILEILIPIPDAMMGPTTSGSTERNDNLVITWRISDGELNGQVV